MVNGRRGEPLKAAAECALLTSPAYFSVLEEAVYQTPRTFRPRGIFAFDDLSPPDEKIFVHPTLGFPTKFRKRMLPATKRSMRTAIRCEAFMIGGQGSYGQADSRARVYDRDAKPQAYERIPYVLAPAVNS